ncbi:hypothetical protein PIB30_040129 [Stylosanthes scabra]|uniref:Uncharacterized protein n=1 Tax=Stylosanthes scabra TaxID=79078 RepID=A0ABU6TE69_9FABA|nr:hypothetical protein [Stylosanthes scabra]
MMVEVLPLPNFRTAAVVDENPAVVAGERKRERASMEREIMNRERKRLEERDVDEGGATVGFVFRRRCRALCRLGGERCEEREGITLAAAVLEGTAAGELCSAAVVLFPAAIVAGNLHFPTVIDFSGRSRRCMWPPESLEPPLKPYPSFNSDFWSASTP